MKIAESVDGAPQPRPRYQLSELLALCNPGLPLTADELEWLDAPAVGLEEGNWGVRAQGY